MLFGAFRWNYDESGSSASVSFMGRLDELVKLESLLERVQTRSVVRMSLSGVTSITSVGVREWHKFINAIPRDCSVELEECSSAFVSQLNTIKGFAGHAKVKSVYAPFVCDTCGHDDRVLVRIAPRIIPSLDFVKCPRCVAVMTFDDVAEHYFDFVSTM